MLCTGVTFGVSAREPNGRWSIWGRDKGGRNAGRFAELQLYNFSVMTDHLLTLQVPETVSGLHQTELKDLH